MKKVAVFIINPIRSPYKNDQYDSFRSEGRYSMNIGFGLALLGFEANIIMNEWTVDSSKQVFNNVYLSNTPKHNHYDYVLTWAVNTLDIVNFDKAIFMDWAMLYVNNIYQFINNTKKEVIYICPTKYFIEYAEKNNINFPIKVNYLPALFPIPSINVGFKSYKSCLNDLNSNELKIYMYHNTEKTTNKYILKEHFIINYFKNKFKDKKIKLYLHTNLGTKCPFDVDNVSYLYDIETRYIDIINTISSVDLCIIPGSNSSGPCLADAISLGKPIIFISDSFVNLNKDIFGNCIYEYPNYLFYLQESDEDSEKKLEKFIQNPKESYDKFKEAHKDLDFNNWKIFAKKYFIS